VLDLKKFTDLLNSCVSLNDIITVVNEEQVTSMFMVVDLLLCHCYYYTPSRMEEQLFLTTLETICSDKNLQKVSRQYLQIIITALNYSTPSKSDQMIALLSEIRNNDKLSTSHENVIIKRDKRIVVTEDTDVKYQFIFNHPGTGTCTVDSESECGFIVRGRIQDDNNTTTLCTNSEDYSDSGIHLHDIISADEMFLYSELSSDTPDGNKIRVVGIGWWWWYWLSDIKDWSVEQRYVAYKVTDYLVAHSE
jgi:hypothetical protein